MTYDDTSDKPVDNCRNKIVKNFLEAGDEDFLFMMDSDNPPLGNPLECVPWDKDIVGFPTPIWYQDIMAREKGHDPLVWSAYRYINLETGWTEWFPRGGVQLVDAVGSGALLIARRVLEVIKPAFVRLWNDDGTARVGSDLNFCRRAKEEGGFGIWADYTHPCRHIKERDLAQVHQLMQARDICFANGKNINTPDYWDEQWKKREERVYPTYEKIEKYMADKVAQNGDRPMRVLDFGCGRGDLMNRLKDIAGIEVEGIDFSKEAIRICRERGLSAHVGDKPDGEWDAVICTEVLEHIDDHIEMINSFFDHARIVIYTVPNNCMPPGLEREHRRVYTNGLCERITPHLKEIKVLEDFLVVIAERT
jgi:hypothetical protein